MKKVSKYLGIIAMTAFLGFTSPAVMAQSETNTTTNARVDDYDDDDDGDGGRWGLVGLLGLLGLLGLKRRDGDHKHTTTRTTDH